MSIILLLATCLVTGLLIRGLRQLPRLVFIATGGGTLALVVVLATASSEPITLLGRTLVLDFAERVFLWPAIGISATLAFFGPLTFERAGNTPAGILSNSQGAFFFWSLAPLIVAMAVDNLPLSAFFWAIGLIILILLAQPQSEGRAGGAAQFLLLSVIGTASLLLSNRFLDLYPITPENQDLVRTAFLFLVWGLGLLLSVAPLHIWLGPLADEMPVLGMAFLLGVAQPVGLWLLYQLMARMLWLTTKSPLLLVLLLGGALTAPVGAFFSIAERRQGRLLAYLSLVSLGNILVGFGLGTRLGLASAMLIVLNRAVGIALVAGGFSFVRFHEERRWQLVGGISILIGGLALVGLGWVPAVPALWGIYHILATSHPTILALLIGSNFVASLAVIRTVFPIFTRLDQAVKNTGETKIVPYLCTAVVIALIVLFLVTALFPNLLADPLIPTLGAADYLK